MTQDKDLRIRLTSEEKLIVERKAKEYHFHTVSEYVRFVITNFNLPNNVVSFKDEKHGN